MSLTRASLRALGAAVAFGAALAGLIVPTSGSAAITPRVPTVLTYPGSGPPTSMVEVHGTGFASGERVDVYFDATTAAPLGSFVAPAAGEGITAVKVPAWAKPKQHVFIALGARSKLRGTGAFLVRTDWPQAGFDARHTSFNPYENVITKTNLTKLVGKFDLGYPRYRPVVGGGILFASESGKIVAYDARSLKELWRRDTHGFGNILAATPAVADGQLFEIQDWGGGSQIVAMNPATGVEEAWSYTVPATDARPLTVSNHVLYAALNGGVYAFQTVGGKLLWRRNIGPLGSGSGLTGAPTIANGMVYLTVTGGRVYALDAATGAVKWSVRPRVVTTSWVEDVVVSGSTVYTTLGGPQPIAANILYALDSKTGAVRWQRRSIGGPAAFANGALYVAGYDSYVRRIAPATGAGLWSKPFDDPGIGGVWEPPTVANGMVFTTSGFVVQALDAVTGKQLGTAGGGSYPTIADGMLYTTGEVYGF